MSQAAAISAPRAQSVVQRAYVYAVALVSIHMVVLGVANILRVLAEIALGAPSGGFTGLPFVFADFNRPRDLYREQASLAIALLLVGTPAWWWHFRLAQRAAVAIEERASALRSAYVHVVLFVTALLVFGYGQRALRLLLQGMTFGSGDVPPGFFGLEPDWPARAAGAGVMALTSAAVLAFHVRLSLADRRATTIAGRAADIRHLAFYTLVVIGLFFATFTTATTIDGMLRRAADEVAPLSGFTRDVPVPVVEPDPRQGPGPTIPPGVPPKPPPISRDDILRFQLLVLVFGAVWLFHRRVVEGEAARESESARAAAIRRLYIYLISAIGLAMAAVGVAGAIGVFGSQLMGINTHSHEETARYVAFVLVGGAAWAFHWRTARARLDDDERRSAQRRLYLYAAVLGGVLGLLVFGSAALYRLLNAALALSFTLDTWHDVWHFAVDSTVAGATALWSFRAIRADRAALGAAGDESYGVTVLVRAADRESARARVSKALAGDPDLSVKG